MGNPPTILTEGLSKAYDRTTALDGLDLVVEAGTVLGVLGPNGAGKTTMVRILTTLLKPDRGRAEIVGIDVVKYPGAVRACIGLAGQFAAVDELLTGYENLKLFGQLARLPEARARRRASDLLARFDLGQVADRLVKTYSGGMRRRLDLAASLILSPPVLFLDEPTTGLDPRGRFALWEAIGDLAARGTTVLLTTQYLEEADRLAHLIVVIDHGCVIARGTSNELKAQIGGERLHLTLARSLDLDAAVQALLPYSSGEMHLDREHRHLAVPVIGGARHLAAMVRQLDDAGVLLEDLALRRPTLDDVFLALTGHGVSATSQPAEVLQDRRSR